MLFAPPWLLGASLLAQETTGSLEGWVLEGKGEPVASASVVMTSVVLQGVRGTLTNEQGYFRMSTLPPGGNYSVKIGHISFKPTAINNVRVFLGRTTSIGEIRLENRDLLSPEIVITGAQPLIDSRLTTTGVNLTDDRFELLPVDRSYVSMVQLAPQSSPSFYGDGTNIAGATGIENRYFMNGADVTDAFRGFGGAQLPYNFIREVQVRSSAYEAEYQSSLGGIVNVITYSGGNEMRGQAFGFYTSNLFSGSPRLALGKPPKGDFSEYDVGLSLGGPIVKDKVWYFLAYNPRVVNEVVAVTGQLDQRDQSTTHMFASKLTWCISESNVLSFCMNGDPATRRGVGVTFTGPQPPYFVSDLDSWLSNIRTGGMSVVLNGTHMLGNNLILESSISMVSRKDEYNPVDHSEPYLFIDYGSNTIGGTFQRTHEATTRVHGGLRGTLALDEHTLKAGIEYTEMGYESSDAWQYLNKFSDSSFLYTYRDFAGNAWIRDPSFYVQDSWQISERLCVNAGVRWDPQFLIASDGTVSQKIMGGVGPRFGIVYRPGMIGSQKVTASIGRFYQPLSLSLPTGYHIRRVNTYDVSYPQDPRVDTTGAVTYPGVYGFFGNVPDLEGQFYDEVTLGYENEIFRGLWLGIRGTYRNLGQGIEDGWSTKYSRYVYGNPGSPPLEEYPKLKRQYTSLELSAEWADPTGLSLQASYSLSRNYGNFEGLADVTYSSVTGGLELWPNTSVAFQFPQMMTNALGLLPDDRTHAFKFFGCYSFAFGLAVGASGYWMSGTPLNELGKVPESWAPAFLKERGSVGRTPSIWDLNLRFVYDLANAAQATWHPRLIVDVLHVFSQKEAVQMDQQHYWTADANGNQLDPNTNYGAPIQFQPPMSVRLGMEVNF